MEITDRAAQFAPFMALTGYEDAVHETARLTEEFVEPDEEQRAEMDRRLAYIMEHLKERPEVTVTVFQPDCRKTGGSYRTVTGKVKSVDDCERRLVFEGGESVLMELVVCLR